MQFVPQRKRTPSLLYKSISERRLWKQSAFTANSKRNAQVHCVSKVQCFRMSLVNIVNNVLCRNTNITYKNVLSAAEIGCKPFQACACICGWRCHLLLGPDMLLLSFGIDSYTNFGMCVSFILDTYTFKSTIIYFKFYIFMRRNGLIQA